MINVSNISASLQRNAFLRTAVIVGWFLFVGTTVVLFLFNLTLEYAELIVPCTGALGFSGNCNAWQISPAEVAVLSSWGLSIQIYAWFVLLVITVQAIGYFALAGLILWRQGINGFGLAVSMALVAVPFNTIVGARDWSPYGPTILIAGTIAALLSSQIQVIFLYLIPNGRISPKWAYIPLLATMLILSLSALQFSNIILIPDQLDSIVSPLLIGLILLGGGLQIYRYVRDSNVVEQQQTKWVIFGIVSYVLAIMVWVVFFGGEFAFQEGKSRLLAILAGHLLVSFFLLILPVAITIAILRYKLWGIDLIIRRTLIYVLLSGLLAFVYFGLVTLLQTVFHSFSSQESPFVIILSTLVIAALFAPLRRRIQTFIDRRFYRRKYDAAQTLAQFANTVQDEVDIGQLQQTLVQVVTDTLQPTNLSLWLKPETAEIIARNNRFPNQ